MQIGVPFTKNKRWPSADFPSLQAVCINAECVFFSRGKNYSPVHTRLRTMISEPACTARWRGVSLEAS